MIYMFLSNNSSSGDIISSNLPCYNWRPSWHNVTQLFHLDELILYSLTIIRNQTIISKMAPIDAILDVIMSPFEQILIYYMS